MTVITALSGNLLHDDAQALVNTVNTVGVMGKGLALQFKRAFPEVFEQYATACREGRVQPGRIHAVPLRSSDRWVLNFPTKRHWRQRSRIEDIEAGLDDLVLVLAELKITSVAVPPLGCGNGGLDWVQVHPLIMSKLGELDVDVRLYDLGTPQAAEMPTRTDPPELTLARARLLAALSRYIRVAWESGVTDEPHASLVEVQKVAYLLQKLGLGLGLRFIPHLYGPFSGALNRALSDMEGHYIVGFGDGTGGSRADLRLTPEGTEAAEALAGGDPDFEHAWSRLQQATLGYEYADGMELLATVLFLATEGDVAGGPEVVATGVAQWSPRKRRMFGHGDVFAAWDQLHRAGLLPADPADRPGSMRQLRDGQLTEDPESELRR